LKRLWFGKSIGNMQDMDRDGKRLLKKEENREGKERAKR